MRLFFLALVVHGWFVNCSFTQSVVPHISGTVKIDIKKGNIECFLEYSHLPSSENYRIAINKAMEILIFSDASSNIIYQTTKDSIERVSNEAYLY
jgi:hypothetical protein